MARIYIHIEVEQREFEGRFLLSLVAAERGHTVLLGNVMPLLRKNLLQPGIVFDKSLAPRHLKIKLMKELKTRGFSISSIDEESGILGEDYGPFASKRYSEETVALSDAVFFWGSHDFATLQRTYGDFASRFHLTGNPRVDMWRPELSKYYDDSPSDRPYVLLSSNFGSIFRREDFPTYIRRLRRMGYISSERLEDPWEDRSYRFWQEGVEVGWEFIKAFRHLARRFPEFDFIVRPHPTESLDRWRELLGPTGNLMIRNQGSISPWIRHAKAVVNHGCTSAIETALSGTPLINYDTLGRSNPEREFANSLGLKARTYDELETLVDSITSAGGKMSSDTDLSLLESRLASLRGPLSSDNIVDVWDRLERKEITGKEVWNGSLSSRLRPLSYQVGLEKAANSVLGVTGLWRPWKFQPFNSGSVARSKAMLSKALGRFQDIPVQMVGTRVLKIG